MSSKELLEETNKLLSSTWEDSEKILVKRMVDSLISYKALIPKSLKQDVIAMLQMANRIKTEYDMLLEKYPPDLTVRQALEKESEEFCNIFEHTLFERYSSG